MADPISTALTGLGSAAQRVNVSANNIANMLSTRQQVNGKEIASPYEAQRVVDSSVEPSGVRSITQPLDPATFTAFYPQNPDANDDGLVELPNVDLPGELVDQILAKNAYKANVYVINREREIKDDLYSVLS